MIFSPRCVRAAVVVDADHLATSVSQAYQKPFLPHDFTPFATWRLQNPEWVSHRRPLQYKAGLAADPASREQPVHLSRLRKRQDFRNGVEGFPLAAASAIFCRFTASSVENTSMINQS
jgi:hypothetical protein